MTNPLANALQKAGINVSARPKGTPKVPKPEPEPVARDNGADLLSGVDLTQVKRTQYAPSTGKLGTLAQRLKEAALAVDPAMEPGNPVVLDIQPGVAIVAIPLQYPAPSKDRTALFLTAGGRSHHAKDAEGTIHADVPIKCSIGVGRFSRQQRATEE